MTIIIILLTFERQVYIEKFHPLSVTHKHTETHTLISLNSQVVS